MKAFILVVKFLRIPWIEKCLFFRGLILSAYIKVITFFLPFKYIHTFIYYDVNNTSGIADDNKIQIGLAKKTINRIYKYCFWNIDCLNKAILANSLLKCLGINSQIKFSVNKSGNRFNLAHAWVLINERNSLYKISNLIDIN